MSRAHAVLEPPRLPRWLEAELPFPRKVLSIADQRVHLIDHQAHHPHAVLLMHGNPTWSFLWRKVIHALSGKPLRLVAPDLVGLGLSSKPRRMGWHTLERHVEVMTRLVDILELETITVVGQDWGGPIVGGVAAARSERVHSALFANTSVLLPRKFKTTSFHRFANTPVVSDLAFRALGFPLQTLHMVQGDRKSIGSLERRAYRYPLRRLRDRAAPLALARMVPTSPEHPTLEALAKVDAWVRGFDGPLSLVWGQRDPVLGRAYHRLAEALSPAFTEQTQAGHFLQEEVPELLAAHVLKITGHG